MDSVRRDVREYRPAGDILHPADGGGPACGMIWWLWPLPPEATRMTAPTAAGRTWRPAAAGGGVALLGAAAAWFWWSAGPPEPAAPSNDPRVTYTGPFRNVRPDVKYVGDAVCAECHADLATSYSHHPMGQAMAPVATATPIERYDPKHQNPFQAFGLWYEISRVGGKVTHRERSDPAGKPVAEIAEPVAYAIGSGAKARSYALDKDGYLFQSPTTWYPGGARWDLSPSYELRNWHFGRAIAPGCLFCHCNYADHVEGTVNRYRPPVFHGMAIGCERCHGPGELHAANPGASPDDTIVNPARLDHHLRQAICEQCHVQGEERVVGRGRGEWDFRPGLPLHPFLMDFVDVRNGRGGEKFVSSVEEMRASRCYVESREPNKLGCTSCHDPHRHPADAAAKVTHYRVRCLTCHTDQSCTLPPPTRRTKQADDSCVACHMPQNRSEVNHSSITNHTIPRVPPKPRAAERPTTPGPEDLVPFHRALIAPDDPDAARNLGIARIGMLARGMPTAAAKRYAASGLPLLDAAVARDPADWPAVEARADALWLAGRTAEARQAYAAAVAARPEYEKTRFGAGTLALEMGRTDEAREHLEAAVRINPHQAHYRHELAKAYARLGQPDRAAAACRAALRLDPFRAPTRSLLVLALLADGRHAAADAEFAILRELTPVDQRADLDRWYREEKARVARPGGP